MPLTIQRNTMIQAASRLTTTHQFRVPRSSTDGEMLRVSRYQKYVVGLLIYNVVKKKLCQFHVQRKFAIYMYLYQALRKRFITF